MKRMFAAAVITVMTMSAALPVFAAAPAQGYGRGRQQQPAAVAVQECITQDDALAIAMKHAGVTSRCSGMHHTGRCTGNRNEARRRD